MTDDDIDVSILVLLDHPHRHPGQLHAMQVAGFRSLFCWITLIGERQRLADDDGCRVSILVLLDHPHRP